MKSTKTRDSINLAQNNLQHEQEQSKGTQGETSSPIIKYAKPHEESNNNIKNMIAARKLEVLIRYDCRKKVRCIESIWQYYESRPGERFCFSNLY